MILHLRAAVEQLYAVPPARFTPLRSELVAEARSAGDNRWLTRVVPSALLPSKTVYGAFVAPEPNMYQVAEMR